NTGQDFETRDGFRMYHGQTVPGFPVHPHKGFETVTVVTEGFVDHFDSKGGKGRYGNGDVQWLTTGKGSQHAEMFPLVHKDKRNPLELFQIWLNLSAKGKAADPDFNMLWHEDIPEIIQTTEDDRKATVRIIMGNLNDVQSLEPNDASWAKDRENHVGIFLVRMEAGAVLTLPSISDTMNRNVYFYECNSIEIKGTTISSSNRIKLCGDEEVDITNGSKESYLLILEGKPIQESVAQHGPFVMNTREELYQAFREYETTRFGGWPWDRHDPVN